VTDLREMECEEVDWIQTHQNMVRVLQNQKIPCLTIQL